jgi:hypothetical protein
VVEAFVVDSSGGTFRRHFVVDSSGENFFLLHMRLSILFFLG